MKTLKYLLTAYQEMHNKYGDSLISVLLFGSQNYNTFSHLADEESDFDFKAIVFPTLEDVVLGKTEMGKKHTFEFGEVTVYTLKDFVVNGLIKQNINFVETLFTEYKVINPIHLDSWNKLLDKREAIARLDERRASQAIFGMIKQSQKRYYNRANEQDYQAMRKMVANIHRLTDTLLKYLFDKREQKYYSLALEMSCILSEEVYALKKGKQHPNASGLAFLGQDINDFEWIQEMMNYDVAVAQEYLNLASAGEDFAPVNHKMIEWLNDFVVRTYQDKWMLNSIFDK